MPCRASLLSNFTIYNALNESRPEVGSSSNIKLGSDINSIAIAILFLSPPEIEHVFLPPIIEF